MTDTDPRILLAVFVVALGVTAVARRYALSAPLLLVVVGLAAVALVGRGKLPFYAAIAIALLDVSLLTVVAR